MITTEEVVRDWIARETTIVVVQQVLAANVHLGNIKRQKGSNKETDS